MTEENFKSLNLDAFVPEDREVKIKGETYLIRGDASVKMTLKLIQNAGLWQQQSNSPESIDKLIESIQEFFITPIKKEVLENLSMEQLPKLIAFIYSGKNIEKEENEKNATSQPS